MENPLEPFAVEFVGGPFRGSREVSNLTGTLGIRFRTHSPNDRGETETIEAEATYVIRQIGSEVQYHFAFVHLKNGQFMVEYVGGPVAGWHRVSQAPETLPEKSEIQLVREEQRDKSRPYSTAVYEMRVGDTDSEWRYMFLGESVDRDVALQLAIDENYRSHDPAIFTIQPTDLHRQVQIEDGHRRAAVDELIAPLILECWRCGWDTMGSCQQRPDGMAYISFPWPEQGNAFAALAKNEGLEVSTKASTMGIRFVGRDEKASYQTIHARFDPSIIDPLVIAVGKSRKT